MLVKVTQSFRRSIFGRMKFSGYFKFGHFDRMKLKFAVSCALPSQFCLLHIIETLIIHASQPTNFGVENILSCQLWPGNQVQISHNTQQPDSNIGKYREQRPITTLYNWKCKRESKPFKSVSYETQSKPKFSINIASFVSKLDCPSTSTRKKTQQ